MSSFLGGGGGGGGGTPGGSTGQLQYNNSGVFGGAAGTSWNNSTSVLTILASQPTINIVATLTTGFASLHAQNDVGDSLAMNMCGSAFPVASLKGKATFGSTAGVVIFSDSANPSGGSDPISLRAGGYDTAAERMIINPSGTVSIVGGTVTASTPPLSITQTWNNSAVAFQGLFINITNTASLNVKNNAFLDFQVNGTDIILFNTAAQLYLQNASDPLIVLDGSAFGSAEGVMECSGTSFFQYTLTNHPIVYFTSNGNNIGAWREQNAGLFTLQLAQTAALSWGGSNPRNTAPDTFLTKDATGITAQVNTTNAQAHRLYNTFTSSTSFERACFDWQQSSNIFTIGTEKGSGGGSSRDVRLICGGTEVAHFSDGLGAVTDLLEIGWGGVTPTVAGDQFSIASTTNSIFSGYRWAASLNGATITLCHTRQGTIGGTPVALQLNDLAGQIVFNGDDGVSGMLFTLATVSGRVDDTVSNGIVPGRLVFKVTNAAGTFYEASRIDSKGSVHIGDQTGISYTASTPLLTMAQTWNNAAVKFTGVVLNITNTASLSSSLLADFQVGGTSKVSITLAGRINTTSDTNSAVNNANDCDIRLNGSQGNGMFGFTGSNGLGFGVAGNIGAVIGNACAGLAVAFNGLYAFAPDGFVTTTDTGTSRSAAGVIAFGNGTQGDASAVILAKTKAGAPTTTDVPAGTWILIRDTTNGTTKMYYNNAGTLQTVALV